LNIQVIAFDADDTLWINETYFREAEEAFADLLEGYLPRHAITKELYKTEIKNIELYGYGVKAFILSMIETAMEITQNTTSNVVVEKVIKIGREMLAKPVILLENVVEILTHYQGRYKLVLATKGDLIDQERKLRKSGLENFFHHIEIMSEKDNRGYEKLFKSLDVNAENFVMIGNSLKSDVLPVLNLGGIGIHIPFHTTWEHEMVDVKIDNLRFYEIQSLLELKEIID
jgi:putative hydrolase of the HAD superfamily